MSVPGIPALQGGEDVNGPDDDGRPRCEWAGGSALYRDYHDNEWGRPLRGRVELFERMTLEAFQSGLSWLTILRKRENFRRAFDGFDIETMARYTDRDVARLMADPGIVRNRAKIEAAIGNARVAADLDVDLSDLLWSFAPVMPSGPVPRPVMHSGPVPRPVMPSGPVPRPAMAAEVPSQTPESVALARDLRQRGFRFVGPTTAYALMQATGMVDDHVQTCWVSRRAGYAGPSTPRSADREQWS